MRAKAWRKGLVVSVLTILGAFTAFALLWNHAVIQIMWGRRRGQSGPASKRSGLITIGGGSLTQLPKVIGRVGRGTPMPLVYRDDQVVPFFQFDTHYNGDGISKANIAPLMGASTLTWPGTWAAAAAAAAARPAAAGVATTTAATAAATPAATTFTSTSPSSSPGAAYPETGPLGEPSIPVVITTPMASARVTASEMMANLRDKVFA